MSKPIVVKRRKRTYPIVHVKGRPCRCVFCLNERYISRVPTWR